MVYKIEYRFYGLFLFDMSDQPFAKCSLVKGYNSLYDCLYFNNKNDKILWLLKWGTHIDNYIKEMEKRQMFARWTTNIPYSIHKPLVYTSGV